VTNGNVLGFLGAPDRGITLRAVSLALLKVRALDGMTCEKLGKTLECSVDTVRTASNEESLLSADSLFRLLYFFPDECAPIREAFEHPTEPLTTADRVARIEHELDAIRREIAA
jgi:hypothetical protein